MMLKISKIITKQNLRQISHQSIAEVDDEVSDVTSEPGTPNDNKPITASRAEGHTLKQKEKQTTTGVMSQQENLKEKLFLLVPSYRNRSVSLGK